MHFEKKPNFERIHLHHYEGRFPANLDYKDESMAAMMLESCNKFHKYDAIKYTLNGITHTEKFDEFGENIEQTAKMIKLSGAKQGERVMVLLPWLPEAYHDIYGAIASGNVLVPLHPNETKSHKRMIEILRLIAPCVIVCLDSCVKDLDEIMAENKDIAAGIRRVVWTTPVNSIKKRGIKGVINPIIDMKYAKSDVAPEKYNPLSDKFIEYNKAMNEAKNYHGEYMTNVKGDDDAVILFSSGTSGKTPDACVHSSNAFNSIARSNGVTCDCLEPGQKAIIIPGLFHGFGLGTGTHTPLNAGCTQIVVPNPKDLHALAEAQKRENAEIHVNVPLLLTKMKESHLFDDVSYSNTKLFISGGGSGSENTMNWWNEKLPEGVNVREGYGSTQMVAGTCINLRHKQKPNSIGVPIPDYYYKLVDPETEKVITEPNVVGEAYVAGPSIMKRVLGDPNPKSLKIDEDGITWYKTSDLLRFDEEGWYYFVERADDVLNMNNGNLVNPHDIKKVLQKFGIEEAVIFKVAEKSTDYEKIVAVVEYKADQEFAEYLKEALSKSFKHYLKSYEVPSEIIVLPKLPLSLNGKPLRAEAKETYEKGEYSFKLEMKR